MFEHLGKVLVDFPGAANQTRCFAHTINLCAKSILKHFDLPKKNDMDSRALDRAANALADLADNLDNDAGRGREKGKSDEEEADDQVYLEAWASVCDGLADNKIQELDLSVQPARSMLAKVCPSVIIKKILCLQTSNESCGSSLSISRTPPLSSFLHGIRHSPFTVFHHV
jgi:hypothetical protein